MNATHRVRDNIRRLREGQGLTYSDLSAKLAATGCVIPVLGLSRIEKGTRRVEVGELEAFGAVFGVEPWSLAAAFDCPKCKGEPPAGYRCITCGMEAL